MGARRASYTARDRNSLRCKVWMAAPPAFEGKSTCASFDDRSLFIDRPRVQCEIARTRTALTTTYGDGSAAQLIERPF